MTDRDGTIGVHCSCGVSFSIDIEARDVDALRRHVRAACEVLDDGGRRD